MRISSAILFIALIGGSLEPAKAQLKLAAVPVDSALGQQIRDSIEKARADGDLPRLKRELSRLLELYPNDPAVRAPIYLALAQVSSETMDATREKQYEVAALTLNPKIGELRMGHKEEGVNRGGGDDKLSTILGVAVQIMSQVQQARQQRAANMPQPAQQMYQQANAFPAAPVGMPSAPVQQANMPMPGGYSTAATPMVMGYDANNQPIYSQPGNGQAAQPTQNPPAAYGQYPAPAGPANAYPAPQQQAQAYPQQQGYPAPQQAYPPRQQQYAPPPQPMYPAQAQQAYPPQQQQAYPAQQQGQAYPPQQSYPPQQQPYPQQAYPQQGTQYGYPAPIQNPYGAPANYARRTTRGAEMPSIKMFYDRFHAGDAAYFQNPCASLLDVDTDGTVTLTPGCGEKALLIPASDIVDIGMNVAVGKQVGAFHIETAKGLYLTCTGAAGTREESLEIVRSLRQKLALGE